MEVYFCTGPRQAYRSMCHCLPASTSYCVLYPARTHATSSGAAMPILQPVNEDGLAPWRGSSSWPTYRNPTKRPNGVTLTCSGDTFAVELLLAGVPIAQVSLLLGHSSVKVTEKHYAPFVKARQEQLAQSARKAWENNEETPSPKPQKRRQNQNGSRSSGDHTRLPVSRDLTGNAQPTMDA